MNGWADDDDGEGRAMTRGERFGALCVCLFLVAAIVMLCVEVRDITLPLW